MTLDCSPNDPCVDRVRRVGGARRLRTPRALHASAHYGAIPPQVLGVFATRQAGALHHKGALVVGAVVGALEAHGRTSTEAARAGCYALRALCLARSDQGDKCARLAARQRLDELRSMEGARHLKATLDAQGHKLPRPLRTSCVELLQDMGAK